MSSLALSKLKKKRIPLNVEEKAKKKINRFDGLSEEEVQKHTLCDYLEENLDMVFVGINPSLMAAHRGRYYAGPGNHFYKLLHASNLTPRFVSYEEDYKLPRYGIGLTNIVARATRSSADLKRTEIKEGAKIVEEKLKFYKPKIAIFNGKCIYEVFADKSGSSFNFGLQPERIGDTSIWVVPSSSARCANFPRMVDKLHFFTALRKYLLYLKGEIANVDVREFWFDGKCKQFIPSTSKMWRRKNMSAFLHGGRIANKDTIDLDTSEDNIAVVRSTEFIVTTLKPESNSDEDEKEYFMSQKPIESCSDDETKSQNFFIRPSKDDKTTGNKEPWIFSAQTKENDITRSSPSKENNFHVSSPANIKTRVRNRRTYKKIKRLSSPKRVSIQNTTTRDSESLDFVKLIKQRLSQKNDNKNTKIMQDEK